MATLQPKLQIKLDLDPAGVVKGASLVAKNLTGIGKSADQSSGKLAGFKRSLHGAFRIAEGITLFNIIRKITRAIEGMAKVALDFDEQMRNVTSISGNQGKDFQALTDAVINLALDPRVKDGPAVLASGLYDIESSGFQANDAIVILTASSYAASAGLTTTAVSAAAIVGVLNAYGMKAEESTKVSNILFQVVNKGVVTFPQLANSIGTVLPMAAQLGVSLTDLGAAYITMTKQKISADESTTQIGAILNGLLKPTDMMSAALLAHGYATGQAAIADLGFAGTVKLLNQIVQEGTGNIGDYIVNLRDIRGVMALNAQGGKLFDQALDDMNHAQDGAGATAAALAEQMKSVAFQIAVLKKGLQILAVLGFGLLAPYLVKALTAINNVFSKILISFRHFREKGYGFFDALRAGVKQAITDMFGPEMGTKISHFVVQFEEAFKTIKDMVLSVAPAFMAFFGFMVKHMAILGPAIFGAVIALKALSVILTINSIIVGILNFELTPLIVIMVVIAAAGALFAIAWSKNWFHIREHTANAVKFIGKWLGKFWDFIHPVIKQIEILGQYWSDVFHHRIEPGNLPKVAGWMLPIIIITGRVVKAIRVFFKVWQDHGFIAALRTIPKELRALGRAIAEVLDGFGLHHTAADLKVMFYDMAKVFTDVVNLVGDIVHGRWGKVWKDFLQLAKDFMELTIARMMLIPSLIYDILIAIPWGTLGHWFHQGGRWLMKEIWRGIKSLGGWIKKNFIIAMQQMYAQFIWWVKGFYDAGRMVISWIWTGIASLLQWIWAQMSNIPGWLMSAITWYATGFYNVGRDIVSGIWTGISSLGGWLWNMVANFVQNNILHAAEKKLGINSPSKEAAKIGIGVPEGFVVGMLRGDKMVQQASIQLAGSAIGGLSTGGFNAPRRSAYPSVNPTSLNGGRPAGTGFMAAMASSRSVVFQEGAITVKDSSDPRQTARVLLAEIGRQEAGMA